MKNLSDLKILVIGDIMLDKYVIGNVERISPEAPVPVVDVEKEYCTLGGCGNVAKNLTRVGAQTTCIAVCGNGPGRDRLIKIMREKSINPSMVYCRGRETTIKERIISRDRSTQLLRIDRESREEVEAERIISEINHVIKINAFVPNIILISDYNKGVITQGLMYQVQDIANKIGAKLIIDPKPANKKCYASAFAITPNHKEFEQMREIVNSDFFKNIIVTRGSEGVFIPKAENFGPLEVPAESVEVYNVTGAGDSFVAIFSTCVGLGIDVIQSSRIANKCAAYVVTKPGTTAVPYQIFKEAVRSIFPKENII